MANKHSLIQQVDKVTHAVEILDLFFANDCDLVSSVQVDDWSSFSDHKGVIVEVSYKTPTDHDSAEAQFLCETGRRYRELNFMMAPWDKIKEELETIDWSEMEKLASSDTSAALTFFHEKVLAVLEKLVPARKKSKPRKKSKTKISRMRRTIWRRIRKVKRRISSATSINALSTLIQRKRELEEQLGADYSAENAQLEDQAIFNIKSRPKVTSKSSYETMLQNY